ncbi:MAG: hypothetical protein LUC94_07635 [Clostridiales bacterium]|nr:hypothetical protein [Clostridiales bacterium]
MKKEKRGLRMTVGVLSCMYLFGMHAWAAGTWTEQENGKYSYMDEAGAIHAKGWIYEAEEGGWYYIDEKGYRVCGKQTIAGDTYFFDENGKMLTGWVACDRNEAAEEYQGTVSDDDLYYCTADGKMATGWVTAYDPEEVWSVTDEVFAEMQDDEFGMNRYYFEPDGKICRNERKTIDGKKYVFQEDGTIITGWIYDYGEGASDRYLHVDPDSSDGDKSLCSENPQNLMFAGDADGALVINGWIDAIPPWDDEDDDGRSFYADSSGYVVTGEGARGNGSTVVARRKLQEIENTGTYTLKDWSANVNITRIDGKYYCLEDSGTRLDGILLLTGGGSSGEFADGVYGFVDNAAMATGSVLVEHEDDDDIKDGYSYYYYFAKRDDKEYCKGQGVSGVEGGRLYYGGLAVASQTDTYEVVYLPAVEEKDDKDHGTGFFLVDETGKVLKGSYNGAHYTSSNGNVYRVKKEDDSNDEYGYIIDYYDGDKDDDDHKIWKSLTEADYDYICWEALEE